MSNCCACKYAYVDDCVTHIIAFFCPYLAYHYVASKKAAFMLRSCVFLLHALLNVFLSFHLS